MKVTQSILLNKKKLMKIWIIDIKILFCRELSVT